MQFQLMYSSGSTSFDQQNASIQSTEAAAGVKIVLNPVPFNTIVSTTGYCNAKSHPTSTCSWQLQDYGYNPYTLDPSRGRPVQHRRLRQLRRLLERPRGPADQRDRVRLAVRPRSTPTRTTRRGSCLTCGCRTSPASSSTRRTWPASRRGTRSPAPSIPSSGTTPSPPMTWYLIRRVGQAIAVVIGVMILTFILLHMEPGSAARAVLGLKATPARVAIFDSPLRPEQAAVHAVLHLHEAVAPAATSGSRISCSSRCRR